MTQTVHLHSNKSLGQGVDLSRREDGTFILRTWHGATPDGGWLKSPPPIYLTEDQMMELFDDIGRALILTLEDELAEIMEAM